jgi:hypothetical protein
MIAALITNAKKPRVIMVRGSPNRLKTGFTNIFKTPSTMAKIMLKKTRQNVLPIKLWLEKRQRLPL